VLCRRDNATKATVPLDNAVADVVKLIESSQGALLDEARLRRDELTVRTTSLAEAEEAAQSGFAVLPGHVLAADGAEARLNSAGLSVRLLRRLDGTLPTPSEPVADLEAVVARAY
jgi:prolyl-tRNA synthetase